MVTRSRFTQLHAAAISGSQKGSTLASLGTTDIAVLNQEASEPVGQNGSKTAVDRPNPSDGGVVALVRPPVVYLVAIAAGLGIEAVWPTQSVPSALAPVGMLIVLLASTLFGLSIRELRAARTAFRTRQPTKTIVRTGPYRLSRNPIYLAFTLLQLGIGLWQASVGVLGLLMPALVLVSWGTIAREERYLEQKFGDEYRRYCADVRRWM